MAVIPFPSLQRAEPAARPRPAASVPTIADQTAACVAIPQHPLVALTWLAAAVVVAVGLGPLLSKLLGIVLPAFALVRIGRTDSSH
jgi:hypothetical protein